MKRNFKISYEKEPNEKDLEFISNNLDQNTFNKTGLEKSGEFALFIKDGESKLYGGLSAKLFYGCLYIDELFVAKDIRGKGFGTHLIERAEEIGKENDCNFAAVNTMEWEAKGFYEKVGYKLKYTESGYANNSKLHYLVKILDPNSLHELEVK